MMCFIIHVIKHDVGTSYEVRLRKVTMRENDREDTLVHVLDKEKPGLPRDSLSRMVAKRYLQGVLRTVRDCEDLPTITM